MNTKIFNINNQKINIEFHKTLPSTNTYLKNKSNEYESFTAVIADTQTGGKGRLGRSFFCPDKSGLYFSLLIKEKIRADGSYLTVLSVVAACRAIEEVLSIKCDIKWVNDIFLSGKKVGGILCEGSINENGYFDYAVIGIGLNIGYNIKLPSDIMNIASSLGVDFSYKLRDELCFSIIKHIIELLKRDKTDLKYEYKSRLAFLERTSR